MTKKYFNNLEQCALELAKNNLIKIDEKTGKFYLDLDFRPAFEESYGFESISIKQKKNMVSSRLDIDTTSEVIKGVFLKAPLIASNMSTVVNADFCIELDKLGAMGVMHRAMKEESILSEIRKMAEKCKWVAGSVGVGDDQLLLTEKLIDNGANIIFIDIAHGYSDTVIEFGKKIKDKWPDVKLVLGNTTNTEMLLEVKDFADAIKVGIAQGAACETKNTAGCTEKQFSAVYKFRDLTRKYNIPVISDGGTREPADFTKALAAGANSIMAGKIFAACPSSAADITYIDGVPKKLYAGMASRFVQEKWKGGLKPGTCSEGGVRYLDIGESVESLIERYTGALRSGITYAGGKDIKTFQDNVEFIKLV